MNSNEIENMSNEDLIEEILNDLKIIYNRYAVSCIMSGNVPKSPIVAVPFFGFMFYIWSLNDGIGDSKISDAFVI